MEFNKSRIQSAIEAAKQKTVQYWKKTRHYIFIKCDSASYNNLTAILKELGCKPQFFEKDGRRCQDDIFDVIVEISLSFDPEYRTSSCEENRIDVPEGVSTKVFIDGE